MRATFLIYHPGRSSPNVLPIIGPPKVEELKAGIGGGYLELVPHFKRIHYDGVERDCVAFCDEDGKRKCLPQNTTATNLWDRSMRKLTGVGCAPDYLAGIILVVIGDREFMEDL